MEQNKTGKYFKYAIGEIILVVIGILIALQINNWNENRKDALAEKDFFLGIKNDLTQDKTFILFVLDQLDEKIEAFDALNHNNSVTSSEHRKLSDSLLKVYLFKGQRTFYPISGSFEAAIAGNEINKYKKKKIVQTIIKLYSFTYSRIIDNGEIVDDRWSDLSETYRRERRTKSFSHIEDDEVSLIMDDLYFHYIQLIWYKEILNNAIIEINDLLQQLDD